MKKAATKSKKTTVKSASKKRTSSLWSLSNWKKLTYIGLIGVLLLTSVLYAGYDRFIASNSAQAAYRVWDNIDLLGSAINSRAWYAQACATQGKKAGNFTPWNVSLFVRRHADGYGPAAINGTIKAVAINSYDPLSGYTGAKKSTVWNAKQGIYVTNFVMYVDETKNLGNQSRVAFTYDTEINTNLVLADTKDALSPNGRMTTFQPSKLGPCSL